MESLGWDAMLGHERALGERFLAGLPDAVELYGLRGMDGRVPTFCFNVPGHSAEEVAVFLAEREIAVWHGDYYAVETMKHLGLADGAVRAGIVHYNTEDEVDRLLGRARRAGVRLLLLGGPRFLGRAVTDAALAAGHEVTFFNRGKTNPELYPEVERLVGDRSWRARCAARPLAGTPSSTRAATCPRPCAPRRARSQTAGSTASSRASPSTGTSRR